MAEDVYYCESCGGIMEFDVKTQSLKCPNCDTVVEIENHSEDIVEHSLDMSALRRIRVEEKQTVTMVCSGCGAPVEVDKNSTALSCPYCGSSYVIADKQEETIVPDGVVTFKLTLEDVKDVFRNWIKKRYLAPNALKNLYQHGKFQGMYIPYWTFDARAHAYYRAMGGRNRTETYRDSEGNTRTRTVTDWYATTGNVSRFFDDVLICAAARNDRNLIEGIDNYDTKNMPSYSPDYLSGYGSEVFSVDLETGHNKALNRMSDTLRSMAADDVLRRYDRVKDVRINAHFENETYKHVLVPVYSTNYSFKGRNYTVLINGENGAIKGEYPKSVAKIVAIIIAVAAVIILILSFMRDDSEYYEKNDYNTSVLLCAECDETLYEYEYEMPEEASADFMEV